MWSADNSTGLADKFKVFLKLEASFDENSPEDCNSPSLSESALYPSEAKISLKNLQNFSKYSVRVASLNAYGVSDLGKTLYINTKPAAPSPPRYLSIIFDFSISDEAKVLGILKWNQPCSLNGKFSLYIISLHGSRPGLEDHSIKKATSFQNITLDDLRRGYRYEAKVKAVNLDFQGAFETFSFTAPSGSKNYLHFIRFAANHSPQIIVYSVPLEEDLKDWTTLGNNGRTIKDSKVEMFLRRRMFVSDIGDITGVAFLIFLAVRSCTYICTYIYVYSIRTTQICFHISFKNCQDSPQPLSGYISPFNQTLSPAHSTENGLECSTLYQQTEILPNPIDSKQVQENLGDYNLKFTLGDEHCSDAGFEKQYCNAPLSSEQSYGIIARVFTADAFRDTEPFFIETIANPLMLISTNFIVFSSIIILIFSSLIAVLCCIWCGRKKKKILKAKEAAEADENLLSFTSYAVFDKTPTLKKVYND